ncbi:MAG: type I restriction enzyme HsdR N-terminal domain-containing protein [Bacteroidales bacterium]|nr:type I restriction enzyme HsdR N-terminal domain-containing protein [Bacteroidales bacterium]
MKVFDIIRKQYVELTPEEKVRQYCIHTLIEQYDYPKTAFAVEGSLIVNSMTRRFDVLIYDRTLKPFMIIECKRPDVELSQKTIDQIAAYNHIIKAPYLMITNGESTYILNYENRTYSFCEQIPHYDNKAER